MNKKIKSLVTIILIGTAITFVGCGSDNEEVKDDKKPEITQDEDINTEDDDTQTEDKENTVDDDMDVVKPSGEKPVQPEVEKPEVEKPKVEQISYEISKYDAVSDKVTSKTITGSKEEVQKPWSVFKNLKDFGSIVSDVSLISYEVNENNVGVINVSKEMYARLGSYSEAMMVEHLAHAYTDAYKTEGSIINVEGKAYSTGHLDFGIDEVIK